MYIIPLFEIINNNNKRNLGNTDHYDISVNIVKIIKKNIYKIQQNISIKLNECVFFF